METADAQIGAQICAQTEALLADVADKSLDPLDPEVQVLFDDHIAACTRCSSMLADARRGAAWLEMLKSHEPEPPRDLAARILAQTSLAQTSLSQTSLSQTSVGQISAHPSAPASGVSAAADATFADRPGRAANARLPQGIYLSPHEEASVASGPSNVLSFRARVAAGLRPFKHTVLQPRLAMTAAMAFFSVALTLDLTGIHLNQLRASELRPSNLKRSFYAANAHVARYYDNLRVVYELESRVHDLQRSSADDAPREQTPTQPHNTEPDLRPQNTPQNSPQDRPDNDPQPHEPHREQSHPAPNSGTSRRNDNAPKIDSAGKKTDRPTQYPGVFALATLPSPLRVPSLAHRPSLAHVRLVTPIAAAIAPKKKGDLA